jgi:hypothetical protein
MKALIRLICEDCLRSLEWSSNSGGLPPSVCPHCGGVIGVDPSMAEEESEVNGTS